jgi:serine/threonine-protein kinase
VKLARRVTHPNVARTFDIGEAGDVRFLTMELLDGSPLSRLLARERRMALPRIAPIARAICAGLAAAHEAGVVHRDLKPDNVLVERSGRVAITDFGIARALAAESAAADTQGGVVVTPLYMAPEQITHDAAIGPAADLYALGCMLFEMATGKPPWTGPTPLATAAARLVAPPPDPRDRSPDLPHALAELILRMMARDPAARPAGAAEVGDAIAEIAAQAGASSSSVTLSARPSSPVPRRDPVDTTSPALAWSAPKTLAVLPIANRSVEGDAYLASALTDDLVDLLSASPGVRVRPRAVAERAARSGGATGLARDPRDVGRELDVQVVVTGEIRRHGRELIASIRLLTVEDGFQLWARRFVRDPADFLRIGDEAAAAIAEALLARPVAPRDAPDPEALDLYLRGRYLLRRTWGASADALSNLKGAYERAPHDPRIRLTYARALIRSFSIGFGGDAAAQEAWKLIDDALLVEPRSSEARLGRATLHLMRGEWVAAAMDLRAVLEVDPELQEGVALLGDLLVDADGPAAAAALERALVLDPGHFTPRIGLMRLAALSGDFARARDVLGDPPPDPYDRSGYWVARARLAMWSGDRAEAELVRASFLEPHTPPFLVEVIEVTICATLGEPMPGDLDDRRVGLEGRISPRIAAFQLQYRCEVLAAFGATSAALSALLGADAQGVFDVRWAERCPVIAPLRAEPLFAEVKERIAERAERVRTALGDLATTGPR